MDKFSFSSQIETKSTFTGLANTRANAMSFNLGNGEYILDFSGQLQNDIDVDIKGGATSVTIIVSKDTAANISLEGNIIPNIDLTGNWQNNNNATYTLPGTGHTIQITVTNLGNNAVLKLRNR